MLDVLQELFPSSPVEVASFDDCDYELVRSQLNGSHGEWTESDDVDEVIIGETIGFTWDTWYLPDLEEEAAASEQSSVEGLFLGILGICELLGPARRRSYLVGGGRGGRFIQRRHDGGGGNSKQKKGPQPPADYNHEEHSDPCSSDEESGSDYCETGSSGSSDASEDAVPLGDCPAGGGDKRQAGLGPVASLSILSGALAGRFANMLISEIPRGATNFRTSGLCSLVRQAGLLPGDLTAEERARYNVNGLADLALGPVIKVGEAYAGVIDDSLSELWNMHASPMCGLACVQAGCGIQPTVEGLTKVFKDYVVSECHDSDLAGLTAAVRGGAVPRTTVGNARCLGMPSSSQFANAGLILDPDADRLELDNWVISAVGNESFLGWYCNSLGHNFLAIDVNLQVSSYAFLGMERDTVVLQHDGAGHWMLRRPRSGKRDGAPDMLSRNLRREVPVVVAVPLLSALLGDEYVVRERRGRFFTASYWRERFRDCMGFVRSAVVEMDFERREAASEENVRVQRLRMDPSERNDTNLLSFLRVDCRNVEIVRRDILALEATGIAWFFRQDQEGEMVFEKHYQFSHTNFCAYLEAVSSYHSLNRVPVNGEDDVAGRVSIQRVRGVNIHAVSQMYNQYIGHVVALFGLANFRNFSETFVRRPGVIPDPRLRVVMGPLEGGRERARLAFTPDPCAFAGSKLPVEEFLELQARNKRLKTGTYVDKIKVAAATEVSKNTPVGVAPLGTPLVDGVECGPGFFAENSSRELVKAYISRIIVRDPPFVTLEAFQKFCGMMNSRLLDQVGDHISALGPEPDVENTYRRVMKGKKAEAEIDKRLDLYRRGVAGVLSGRELKKFLHCGVFLKFENNSKTKQLLSAKGIPFRVTGGKPRIICTMGIREEVETAAILEALDVLIHGDLGEHMICGLTVEQLAVVIDEATLADHTTTDFSSWESSARREIVSKCECALILELLERSGWHNLKGSMTRTFEHSQRRVHAKNVVLLIDGRHSGKFITYFANCLLNMYNIWWNAYVRWLGGRDPIEAMAAYFEQGCPLPGGVQIVSGDDGIVPTGTVSASVSADLGFDLGVNVRAVEGGVAPFCSTYAKAGKLYGNVASVVMKLLWIKKGLDLRPQKQMFLMRDRKSVV